MFQLRQPIAWGIRRGESRMAAMVGELSVGARRGQPPASPPSHEVQKPRQTVNFVNFTGEKAPVSTPLSPKRGEEFAASEGRALDSFFDEFPTSARIAGLVADEVAALRAELDAGQLARVHQDRERHSPDLLLRRSELPGRSPRR